MIKSILKYFVGIYALSVILMSLVRLILFFTMISLPLAPNEMNWLSTLFLKGWAFDSLITSYILVLPLLFLFFYSFFSKHYSPKLWRNIGRFTLFLLIPIFAILFINIPNFKYHNAPLSLSDFEYLKYFKTTVGMIISEASYWLYFICFLIFILALHLSIRWIAKKTILKAPQAVAKKLPLTLLFLLLIGFSFIGMRGSLKRYPLRVSNASFCNNSTFNKIALNPVFYLIKSLENQSKGFYTLGDIVNTDKAYKEVQKALGIKPIQGKNISREVLFDTDTNSKKRNVVIILEESLSMDYLKMKQENGSTLMPFLHKWIKKSYFFEHFYSSGNHTNNGILSTLYGFPTIFNRPSLQNKDSLYQGLPFSLKQHGYSNYFFLTGNPNYDNMSGFLYDCGSFDRIYSLEDYPKDKEVNNFGVSDEFLFEFGIKKLNEIAKNKAPFLATFLTVSNHPPLIIPNQFKNNKETDAKRIMMFVDYTLEYFFQEALKQDWAENTIFVVLGDHGKILNKNQLPMALGYNHIPMMIYSKEIEKSPQVFSQFGGQIDIYPTIMGLLKLPYTNNSLGIDLFKEKRQQMFFVSNTHLGCINQHFLYTFDLENKTEGLFEYQTTDKSNKIKAYPKEAQALKQYGFSMQKIAEEEILK